MKINNITKEEIEQIKEKIKYLNELLEYVNDEVIEFEIKKQIKYELNLLKTKIIVDMSNNCFKLKENK